ncbi:helix-turn-helix domain-containing protein [Chloroflexota bacterium]
MVKGKADTNRDYPSSQELISLNEASKLCGFSTSYIRRLVSKNEIWGLKIGRNWVTTAKAVQEFMARDRKPGPKPKKNNSDY